MPSPSSVPSPNILRYRWAIVGMLWFICFFNYADRVAVGSILPLLEKSYHLTKTQQGIIVSAFAWVYALASPLAGQLGDRYSRKWVLLGGLYIWSLVTGFTAICSKFWHFVLVRGAEGLGETVYFPASMAIISDYHTPKTRSRAIGLHQTSVYAGTIGGGVIAGWMGERYGWQSPFILLGGLGIVLGFILSAFIREPKRNQAEREELQALKAKEPEAEPTPIPFLQFLREFWRTPTAVQLIIAFFGANLVAWIFVSWMPTYLKETYHVNLAVAGVGATIFIQLGSMIGSPLGGILADRWKLHHPGGRIRVQAFAALLGAPFVFLCGYTRQAGILMVALTFYGLFKGFYDANLTAAFYDVVPAARRSSATGLMNFLGWIGGGLGPTLIGVATDHHIPMSASLSSTALVSLTVGLILLYTATVTAPRDMQRVHEFSRMNTK